MSSDPSSNLLTSIPAAFIALAEVSAGEVNATNAPLNAVVASEVLIPPAVNEAIIAPTPSNPNPADRAKGRTWPNEAPSSSIVVLPNLTVVNKISETSFTWLALNP